MDRALSSCQHGIRRQDLDSAPAALTTGRHYRPFGDTLGPYSVPCAMRLTDPAPMPEPAPAAFTPITASAKKNVRRIAVSLRWLAASVVQGVVFIPLVILRPRSALFRFDLLDGRRYRRD